MARDRHPHPEQLTVISLIDLRRGLRALLNGPAAELNWEWELFTFRSEVQRLNLQATTAQYSNYKLPNHNTVHM